MRSKYFTPRDAEHPKHYEFKMDTYFNHSKVVERLFREWKQHRKLIIAVDFDDTLYDFHKAGNEHKKVVQLIQECQAMGWYIVIFTASAPERHNEIRLHCNSIDIKIDSINKNPIELPYGNNGKIYYNVLLDDRAGLHSAYLALAAVVNMARQFIIEEEEQKIAAERDAESLDEIREIMDTTNI